jgi:hypothetical protein
MLKMDSSVMALEFHLVAAGAIIFFQGTVRLKEKI